MRLGELGADRAAADDDQVLGPLAQLEDRLVGHVGHAVEAGDRRHGGRGAGRDHEAPRADALAAGLDLVAADEPGGLLDHLDAQTLESLDRVVRGDGRDHAVDVIVDLGEVDARLVAVHAEAAAVADRLGRMAGGDQGLGGDAAGVQAVAAHLALFDQHGLRAHLGSAGGYRKPAGARADHADVALDDVGHRSSSSPLACRDNPVRGPRRFPPLGREISGGPPNLNGVSSSRRSCSRASG